MASDKIIFSRDLIVSIKRYTDKFGEFKIVRNMERVGGVKINKKYLYLKLLLLEDDIREEISNILLNMYLAFAIDEIDDYVRITVDDCYRITLDYEIRTIILVEDTTSDTASDTSDSSEEILISPFVSIVTSVFKKVDASMISTATTIEAEIYYENISIVTEVEGTV